MNAFRARIVVPGNPISRGAARTRVALVASVILIALAGCGSHDQAPSDMQIVDGMAIYLGVTPAELVQGHSTGKDDAKALHGGTPESADSHHVVVALFDVETGARITDARIQADLGDRSYNHGPAKPLEPMHIAGATTYGNFFLMRGEDVWRIRLRIERPNAANATEADFRYQHAVGR